MRKRKFGSTSSASCTGPGPVVHLALPPDFDPGGFSFAIAADSRRQFGGDLRGMVWNTSAFFPPRPPEDG
eukprot:7008755-Alexandrium_andersonii.AAC.1